MAARKPKLRLTGRVFWSYDEPGLHCMPLCNSSNGQIIQDKVLVLVTGPGQRAYEMEESRDAN